MFPAHKTKIVCTLGPASRSPEVLEAMIRAGMDVARLNLSHGEPAEHAETLARLRAACAATGRRVAVLADLPGPKIRVGELAEEPLELVAGEELVLTTEAVIGDRRRVGVSFEALPRVVRPGNTLFLNDGLIELRVLAVEGAEVRCRVVVGGELRSRKGLNLPGIDLGMGAFTEQDRRWLEFALEQGVDAVSQSFVGDAADVEALRRAAEQLGRRPFIIAKIERAGALEHIDAILQAADGIMIARGDLGVEIPIERIALVQKQLMAKANRMGKPVITATHMLESMVGQRRPTRAEATDVANAILDGTDCVMLSGESAVGRYPVEAVAMLARIAAAVEGQRPLRRHFDDFLPPGASPGAVDLIAVSLWHMVERAHPAAVIVPTRSGATARNVARIRLPVWITAFSPSEASCRELQFSYGVYPVKVEQDLPDWDAYARAWLRGQGLTEGLALLVQGPSEQSPRANHQLQVLELDGGPACGPR